MLIAAIIVYIIICVFYAKTWVRHNDNVQEAVFIFIFMLFIPVLSLIFFQIIERYNKLNSQKELGSLLDNTQENTSFYTKEIHKEEEINLIPMTELLDLNDFKTRRKMVMQTLQDDSYEYIDALKAALVNEDAETSHYATAVIMEIQSRLTDSCVAMEKKYCKAPDDAVIMSEYESSLSNLIFCGLFDERNLTKYYVKYTEFSNKILEKENLCLAEKYYLNRINIDFKLHDYMHAKMLCERGRLTYPESEGVIYSTIKYYLLIFDRRGLDTFIEQLGAMSANLTQATLKYIRFIMESE